MSLLIQQGMQSKQYIDLIAVLCYDLAFSFPWKTFVWPEDSISGSVFSCCTCLWGYLLGSKSGLVRRYWPALLQHTWNKSLKTPLCSLDPHLSFGKHNNKGIKILNSSHLNKIKCMLSFQNLGNLLLLITNTFRLLSSWLS